MSLASFVLLPSGSKSIHLGNRAFNEPTVENSFLICSSSSMQIGSFLTSMFTVLSETSVFYHINIEEN
ncbi:hypothetical protein TNCT_256081 [Trichonephila clavata]|uniref:Uncharacterized protein n=1 Tax=Trichonephila clavata TaxID=2740835 RepID=A0A8X6FJZ6_TRICU|nr:hypothetical protein TNCT_256081 [Trichonephila clavata]